MDEFVSEQTKFREFGMTKSASNTSAYNSYRKVRWLEWQNEVDQVITVDGERYRFTIFNICWTEFNDLDMILTERTTDIMPL